MIVGVLAWELRPKEKPLCRLDASFGSIPTTTFSKFSLHPKKSDLSPDSNVKTKGFLKMHVACILWPAQYALVSPWCSLLGYQEASFEESQFICWFDARGKAYNTWFELWVDDVDVSS